MKRREVTLSYWENFYNLAINVYDLCDYDTGAVIFTGEYEPCFNYAEDNDMIIWEGENT